MAYQATRPLDDAETAALARCDDPGWTGLSRVIEQDVDAPCSEVWVARTVAGHLQDRELQWLHDVVADDTRSPRQRLRGSTALLLAGQAPTPDWAFLVTDPRADSLHAYLDALYEGDLPADRLDPFLRASLARRHFLDGDLEATPRIARWLRLVAAQPARLPEAERAKWTAYVLDLAGLGGGRLKRALERHDRGLGWGELPSGLVPVVAAGGEACAKPASAACVALAADLLERDARDLEGETPREAPPSLVRLPIPLWSALYDRPAAVHAAAATLGEVADWVAAAPEEERAQRLLGSVAWPGSTVDVARVRAGLAGDPVDVLAARGGSPWAAALAAMAIGKAAGVDVQVYPAGAGVRLVAGGVEAGVGPCGAPASAQGTGQAPWPARAVLAQATLEAAGAALRRGDKGRALRLASLAEHLDAVGAKGASEAVRSVAFADPAPGWALGAQGGALVASLPIPPPSGAETAREARPAAWAGLPAAWAATADAATCPAVLGP